jgi:hypothetical protein
MTQIHDNSEVFMEHYDMMTEYDLVGSHCDLGLEPDPMSLHLTAIENLDLLLNPNSHYQAPQGRIENFVCQRHPRLILSQDTTSFHFTRWNLHSLATASL